MWWSSSPAAVLALAAALALSACGFRPLYGNTDRPAPTGVLATIEVRPLPDRAGQQLHNTLLDLLNPRGRPRDPRYVLHVDLKEREEGLAVRKNALATRANLRVEAEFKLFSVDNLAESMIGGRARSVASYDIQQSEFATLVARKNARTRAAQAIGLDIRTRLAVFLARQAAKNP